MNLTSESASLWHDLAVCYFLQSYETENTQDIRPLVETTAKIARHCTKLNPSNWEHWNLLGCIHCTKGKTKTGSEKTMCATERK